MDYAYVALYEGKPIAVAHTREDLEQLLLEKHTQGTLVEYKVYTADYIRRRREDNNSTVKEGSKAVSETKQNRTQEDGC